MPYELGLTYGSRGRAQLTDTSGNADAAVVVPMYNESEVIVDVLTELRQSFDHIVCVDDGSVDGSGDLAAAAGATVVRHAVNIGQGAALQTGIEFALTRSGVRFIVTFDADGQHQVTDAVALLEMARAGGYDMVLGSRFLGDSADVPSSRRRLLKAAVLFTRWVTGLSLTDAHNGLRVIRREAALTLDIRIAGMAHASELLAWASHNRLKVGEGPVRVHYTAYSRSKGQPGINALNVVYDLFINRLLAAR